MKIVMVLGTKNDAVREKAVSVEGSMRVIFPEGESHPAFHGELLDAVLGSYADENAVTIATHSKGILTRLFLRVMQGKISPEDVEIVWTDTGRVMKVTTTGGIEGASESPPPRMFGEAEMGADLAAMNQAYILRQNAGKRPQIVSQQTIDARTGQVLEEVAPDKILPLSQQQGLDGQPLEPTP